MSVQLLKKKPPITVDGNGGSFSPSASNSELTFSLVGTIGRQARPSENTWPRGSLGITLLTHLFTRSRNKNKTINRVASSKPRLLSCQYPPRRLPSSLQDTARPSISDTPPENPFIKDPRPPEHESPQERDQREQEEARAKVVNETIDQQISLDKVAFSRYQKATKVLLLGQSESG